MSPHALLVLSGFMGNLAPLIYGTPVLNSLGKLEPPSKSKHATSISPPKLRSNSIFKLQPAETGCARQGMPAGCSVFTR